MRIFILRKKKIQGAFFASRYDFFSEISAGMGTPIHEKCRYAIPSHTAPLRALVIVATIKVELSMFVFLAFIWKSVNNLCYNPYISGKIFSRAFQKCMGCCIDCLPFSRYTPKNTNTEGSTLIVATTVYNTSY